MDYQAILSEVESWPVDDRICLVREVWNRLPEQAHEVELSKEMKAELDRRIDEMDRNPELGIPWALCFPFRVPG